MFAPVNEVSIVVVALLSVALFHIWYSPLFFGPFWTRALLRIPDELDFSQKENVIDPKVGTIYTNLPITTTSVIKHLSDEEILAEKYRAITNREKGRDLYDFLFLLKKGVKFNLKLVEEKLKFYSETYQAEKFIKKIKNWDEKELDNDLRKFLPLKGRDIIPNIKDLLLRKIISF